MDHTPTATPDQTALSGEPGAAAGELGSGLSDRPWFLLAVLIAWVAPGLGAALWLRRRGHSAAPMVALGAVFGPLFLPLSRVYRRRGDEARPFVVVGHDGRAEVLVGIFDPAGLLQSVPALHDVLGGRRSVVLATFADRDSLLPGAEWSPAASSAARVLAAAAERMPDFTPGAVLLPGPPGADGFAEYAHAQGISHVVVLDGPRALSLGSVPEER